MRLTGKKLFLIGFALIALTHGVTLAGVVWNRGGTPTATLKLSERELYRWRSVRDENSQITLHLNWRVANVSGNNGWYGTWSKSPTWLDRAELERLGFDLSLPYDNRKALFLALEMDGPTARLMLRQAQEKVADAERKLAEAPQADTEKHADAEKYLTRARTHLQEEENDNSRLFVVAAGLDAEALRAAHPGPEYAIVRGEITVRQQDRDNDRKQTAYISALSVDSINVPHALRTTVESRLDAREKRAREKNSREHDSTPAFTFAWGQRLEPWLVAADAPAQDPQ